MTFPELTKLQQQFLQEISRKFEFTGDTQQIFIVRFNPDNYGIDDDKQLANKITFKNQIDVKDQKIKDELKNNIYPILKKNECVIESKSGRPIKGNEPWKQAYKWLWEEKYPEWLAQQQTQNNQPEPEPETPQINWREVCQKMLQKQQEEQQRLRRQITELKHEIEIFVPLGLIQPKPARRKEETPFPDAAEGMQQYELKTEEITKQYEYQQFIDEVIGQQTKNLAIIGEPGAGKTTWLSKIAEYLADKSDYPSPICISLSRLENRTLKDYLLHTWLEEALEFIPSQVTVTQTLEENFKQQFKDKRVWLLLDGVDEMKTTENSPLSQLNSQLEGWVNWTRVILTCRLNVWQPNPIANFEYYRTLAFSNVQVRDFIQQWYEKAEKPELGEQLQQKLTAPQHSRIFDLVKNPLRLAMLCQIWCFLPGELPETKANLYQRFVNETYEWKKGEFGTTATQIQQLNQALGKLALRMIDEQISLKESVINDVMSLEEFDLAKRLGWLNWVYRDQKTDEKVYAFFHLSFAEYFAACMIDDWDYFLPKNHVDKPVKGKDNKYRIFENEWNEIFLLWMGRENIDDKKEEFIKKLVNFKDGVNNFYGYQAYFKAGTALAEFKMKNCSLANKIVDQIIKWAFGYFDIKGQKWITFPDPIPKYAEANLSSTDTQKVILALISLLHSNQYEDVQRQAISTLGNIAVGNGQVINTLIYLLNSTQNEDIRMIVARSLGNIAVGNEQAINTLISLLNSTQNEDIRMIVASSLGEMAVGNEQAINTLISLLNSTQNEYTRMIVTWSLEKIALGNEKAINTFIHFLHSTQYKAIHIIIIWMFRKIAVGNEQVIEVLISLLYSNQNKNIVRQAIETLGNIAVGNEQARKALVSLLDSSHDKDTHRKVGESLRKIAMVNEQTVEVSISFKKYSNTENHSVERLNFDDEIVGFTTLNVDPVFTVFTQEAVIERRNGDDKYLTQHEIYLLEEILLCGEDISACWSAANILAQTNPGNEIAISALLKFIIFDKDADLNIASYRLKQALDKSHIPMVINNLKYCLSNEIYENEFERFTCCFKILWQCTKHLTYPQFYQAWHATDTTTLNQLEQQYTDIYTQLKQLQPTSTTYPIPLNAANLEGKTAEKAIAKGILIKIYGEIFPKQKAENIEDIFDLENELQPLREHLNTDKIALIFCDINPHPELIKFCQQLQNDWLKIALITDTPIASPLSGFPPQQDNLLGVVQTCLEELG